MRAVVTRVSSASVSIDGATVGAIGTGFLVLLGIGPNDTQAQAEKLADKICGLRVFADEAGKMNLTRAAVGGANDRGMCDDGTSEHMAGHGTTPAGPD